MKKHTTRRALLMSVLSLLLCVSMLVGTTYAWFTDEVVSGMNTISAGNLDVELLADGKEVKAETKLFADATLWEPGVVVYENLQIVNKGTLALKYQMSLNFGNENDLGGRKLSEVLKVAVIDKIAAGADRAEILAAAKAATNVGSLYDFFVAGELEANKATAEQGVVIFWEPGENDNLYNANNGKTPSVGEALFIEFGVNLLATQKMSESDSFGTDYDKDAWAKGFAVYSASDLQAAINNGEKNIDVMADIVATDPIAVPAVATTFARTVVPATVTINLNGKELSGTALNAEGKGTALLVNEGDLKLVNGTVKATGFNGGATISNKGNLLLDDVKVVGAPISSGEGYPAYCISNSGNLTVEEGTAVIADRGCLYLSGTGETVINGGSFTNNDISDKRASFTSHVIVVGYGANNKLIVNDGIFQHLHTKTSGGVVINNWSAVTVEINGGSFSGGNYFGKWDNLSDYGYGSTKTPFAVKGGTFTGMDDKFLAEGTLKVNNADGTITVITNSSSTTLTMADGATLDLKGAEFAGTVKVMGDLTIKGDTKIKTLSATNGGTITIEDGKTLSLNNFSFGAKSNNTAEYTITGGTITASYGFFQHGKYALHSDFETGYMYYSFGSDITVYGTFHSQGKGDGLDYVRGKLTIANGGKSIHDKSLWVGQPASWGAMNASLTVEEGGYVQANSLSVYDGSVAYNSAANVGKDDAGIKYNTLNGTITVQ